MERGVAKAVGFAEGIKTPDANLIPDGDDREQSPSVASHHGNVPEAAGLPGGANPLGNGGEARRLGELSWDDPLRLGEIKRRFETLTAARLKRRTRYYYWAVFEAFAECEHLERYTRRSLAGRKGRDLLILHYGHIPKASQLYAMAAIKKVWRRGLELGWPLERDDLPKPGRPKRRQAPRREFVEPWIRAAREIAHDEYLKSWLLEEQNGGLRPVDQQAELRIDDLYYNAAGELIGIYAQAAAHDFKRDADIVHPLPPEVAQAVQAWVAKHPAPKPDAFIWPWRHKNGRMNPTRQATPDSITVMRRKFAVENGLPWLTPVAFRHHARTVLNRTVDDKVARDYWMGHAPNLADMDVRYGDDRVDVVLDVQRRALPEGVIGTFLRTTVVGPQAPTGLLEIWRRFEAGELDSLEAAGALRDLLRALKQQQIVTGTVTP